MVLQVNTWKMDTIIPAVQIAIFSFHPAPLELFYFFAFWNALLELFYFSAFWNALLEPFYFSQKSVQLAIFLQAHKSISEGKK